MLGLACSVRGIFDGCARQRTINGSLIENPSRRTKEVPPDKHLPGADDIMPNTNAHQHGSNLKGMP